MITNLSEYKSIYFDCDGVILDSNKVKTEAFRKVAEKYGKQSAEALVSYHVKNGGVSRYLKFEYFLKEILGKELDKRELEKLLEQFAKEVINGLMSCEITPSLNALKKAIPGTTWYVVSGGAQEELREVFKAREIDHYFLGGVFGSPTPKEEILKNLRLEKKSHSPGLFVGDSRYDHVAAQGAGLDFVFVSKWTEFSDWEGYCLEHGLPSVVSISNLLDYPY